MNAPPDQTFIAKLEGCVIDTITFARYVIHVTCEDNSGFSILCPFCFGRHDQIADMDWIDFPLAQTDFLRTLGSSITSAKADEQNYLRIEFSTGDTLLVCWTPLYDSYEFFIGGDRVIV